MDKYDKKVLELSLTKGTPCNLNHGDEGLPDAIDYISQEIGGYGKTYTVNIAVCEECWNGLQSPEWVLLYCLKCNRSQWVYKPLGRLDYYKKHICWMSCCPECKEAGEKVNIFFTD